MPYEKMIFRNCQLAREDDIKRFEAMEQCSLVCSFYVSSWALSRTLLYWTQSLEQPMLVKCKLLRLVLLE